MNIIKKIIKRTYKSLAKSVFPNSLRISLLKCAGVKIGNDVFINEGFVVVCDTGHEGNLIIEDRVAIGPNVIVVLDSHPNNSRLRELKKEYSFINIEGKVRIKHDAWIGAGVIILPNVTIGEFSIVGAGSVVTKNVPPYSVVAGSPARVIRTLDTTSSERRLLK